MQQNFPQNLLNWHRAYLFPDLFLVEPTLPPNISISLTQRCSREKESKSSITDSLVKSGSLCGMSERRDKKLIDRVSWLLGQVMPMSLGGLKWAGKKNEDELGKHK